MSLSNENIENLFVGSSFLMGNSIPICFEENSRKQRKSNILNRVNTRFYGSKITENWFLILGYLHPCCCIEYMGLGSIFRTTWFNLQVVSPVARPFGPSLHLVIFIKLNHTKFQIFNNLGPTKMTISFVQPNIITFQLLNGDSFVYLFGLIQTSRGQGLCPTSKLKSGHISSDNVKYEKNA